MVDLIKPLSKHVVYPLMTWREGSTIRRHLAALEKSQFLSSAAVEELRFLRMKRLLEHAYAHCPFYTQRFDDAGFRVEMFDAPADLQRIPILTKQDIQSHSEEMRATRFSSKELVPDKTGGSTGRPLHFYMDRDRVHSRNAAAVRHDRWTGWDIGDKAAYLWGHRGEVAGLTSWKQRLKRWLYNRSLVLDTSSMNRGRLDQFRRDLLAYRPKIIVGYANAVYLLARFLEESQPADYYRPTGVITSAEVLDPHQREVIERVFECRVFDRYGSRETGIIASECERHTGLHVCAETIYLEIVTSDGPAAPGALGRIVLTDLLNLGMPFIRYQIEDVGKASETTDCPCGRGLPLIDVAAGRDTDFLLTEDGTIVSGAALTIYLIANAPGVAQAQIVQEKRGEILFRIVRDESFGDHSLQFIEEQFPRFFGLGMTYALEYVDAIPAEPSGKYRFSICKLDPAELF